MREHESPCARDALELPSPGSPLGLDRKILAYAAQRAPAPARRTRRPVWLGGLATASIAVVAVLLLQLQSTEMEFTAAQDASQSLPPLPRTTAIPAPAREAAIAAESDARQALVAESKQALRVAPTARQHDTQPETAASAERAISASAADFASEGDRTLPFAALPPPVREELQRIDRLWRAGAIEAASAAYDRLHRDCAHCELPASVDEALQQVAAAADTK